ncbi:MAG: 30S ribosomal protein S4 [Chloroflexi bacterium]|nr:30S ribosomal protein S4 [Chloroflexota bacterium]|tara:strand:+ start:11564 stop:12148 length:585 start_codon:yes stop_codon:yes gene_type:complete
MARYTGPVNKKMRFLGLEIPKKGVRNNRPPARRRLSAYGLQLREKQKARFLYGILEKQFRNYYDKASKNPGSTGDLLLEYLEKRLDNALYRTGMFNTRRQSRQAVNHAHFLVNDGKVNIPSFQIKVGDKITWREKSKKSSLFEIATSNIQNNDCAKWLALDKSELSVQINNSPSASDAELNIDTRQIVEYYSRR